MRLHQEFRTVHGHRRAFLRAGSGPVLLLIHGIGGSSRTWEEVLPLLAEHHTVIAPDLLGHGDSDKPRGDYSLGGFANGMRDLLVLLGVERASVVGHSLGGGVALQFAYQYPQLCERLILVSSGGLGAEVMPLLRAAAIPGAGFALANAARAPIRLPLLAAARTACRLGLLDTQDVREMAEIWAGLREPSTRSAFLRTLRGVIDVHGQAVSSQDRLYLTDRLPMMLVWGGRDPVLPVSHAHAAAESLPGCHLVVVPRAGHLPHRTDPVRFADAVTAFVAGTPSAPHDASRWKDLLTQRAT